MDTGFIVYNERTYPNLTALFEHLDVPTKSSKMSFSVSLDHGRLEYSGNLAGLFAQGRNVASPRFWSMLRDLARFYHRAPRDLAAIGSTSLGDYLDGIGCGHAFRDDHLYPMAAAIWSTPVHKIPEYPAAAFIRFCENHGLLQLVRRPLWRTVDGGSREYVERLSRSFADRIRTGCPVHSIRRHNGEVELTSANGVERFDHAVIATHADQALGILADPDVREKALLSAFRYRRNDAVLHSRSGFDASAAAGLVELELYRPPRRRARRVRSVAVSYYWMNRLQGVDQPSPAVPHSQPHPGPRPRSGH